MPWRFTITAFALLGATGTFAAGPDNSKRPVERSAFIGRAEQAPENIGFDAWITAFRLRALAQGISRETLDNATNELVYDASIIERDRNQAEFTKTIWDYLDTAVSDLRVENGRAALERWGEALAQIEVEYGVEKEVIVAIWGLESAYGTFRGGAPVINGLVTLAFNGRRASFFEAELIQALRILESGDTTLDRMRGSWAGAMGHTQFMPSSYQAHAVDFDGDGKRNIWANDPRDSLASTAAYLRHFGWTTGQSWGEEVQLRDGFDYTLADRKITKLPSEWAALGVAPRNGVIDDQKGPASVLLPGGSRGAAFMVYSNFAVIERYNSADAYVIGVGHLSDRIIGGKRIQHSWPRELRALSGEEREELQERLTAAGFGPLTIDAKMGPLTVSAIRAFQRASGVTPDGFPSLNILERLRLQ